MNNKICTIFGAGDLYVDAVNGRSHLVIAADGGLYHAKKLGIQPDVFLGDFDSASKNDAGENRVVFPSRKDYTDMFLAVEYGIEHGCDTFEIYGGLGGKRIEHTLANLQMLTFYAKKGIHIRLHGEKSYITAFSHTPSVNDKESTVLSFDETAEGYISLFAAESTVNELTVSGLKYPLEKAVLSADFPLGVSNEFIGQKAVISFSQGTLLLVCPESVSIRSNRHD